MAKLVIRNIGLMLSGRIEAARPTWTPKAPPPAALWRPA